MKKRGISLIVLIVTIIVIIILATSIIVNLVNTNSIKRASESVFKSDIRGFADELSLSLANEYLNYKGEFDAKKVNSYNNEVWYGDKKQNKTVQDVITNSKNTDYVGKIFIEEGKLVLDGFELTKEEVKWAKEINIPVNFEKGVEELLLTSDYTSVTAKVPVIKEEVIKEYEYIIYEIKEIDGKEEKNQVNTVTKKENEIIFSGLAQNKLYEVNVKIRFNNEENEVIEKTGRINTKGIEENVTFIQNPSAKKENGEINWTAGNVIVTISHEDIPEGYEIQYKLTGGMTQDWTSGEIVEITENSTLVVGRLYNKTLDDEVSVNSHVVSNIDKDVPIVGSLSYSAVDCQVTNITLSSGTDDLSKISKIIWYYKVSTENEYLTEETIYSPTVSKIEEDTYITLTLSYNIEYSVYIEIYDVVGNKATTDVISVIGNAAHDPVAGGSLASSATCTSAARYYYKCSKCGTELSSTYISGSSLGHSLTSSYDIYQHYSYCTRCNQKFNVTDHSFSSSVCQESTCTTNGYTWFTCNCGYRFKMQDRPLASHTYPSSWSYNTTQHYKNCTVCGTRLSTADHSFTASVYQESTSTVHGYTKYSCSCGYAFLLQDRPLL